MKGRGVVKAIGKLQSFRVEDKSHRRSMEIFAMVEDLERRMNEAESVPYID